MKCEAIDYKIDGADFSGMLVWDHSVNGSRPAVLMAPDWMGVSDGAIEMAKKIAGKNFYVFVADLYGKGILPKSMDEAAALANPLKANAPLQRIRTKAALDAALTALKGRSLATHKHVGAVGFCFGGTNVLEVARMGADLSVAISVHGELLTSMPAREGVTKAKIVILHGAIDPVAPKAHRDAIEDELNAAKVEWWEAVFGGAVHSFTNPLAAMKGVSMYDEKSARWASRIIEQTLIDELVD